MSSVSETSTNKLSCVEDFFTNDVAFFKRCLIELDAEIDPSATPQRDDVFHRRCLEALLESQGACRRFEEENCNDPAVILDVQEGFRKETDPWFSRSWFAHRARTKPSGFAGDYEMLLKLYDKVTPARGIGGYLDLCLMDTQLAQAVRARLAAAREFLTREINDRVGDVRVLDIACGPCREYNDWPFASNDRKIEIVALDSDPKALEFVDNHVANKMSATDLQTIRYNALRTRSAAANKKKFGKFDIIYSVGLCDYLSDEHLIGMLAAWRETLNDGGVLYIAFKDTTRYDKTPYQWHLDWFFFQRTKQDVLDLYEAAGFDVDQMETYRDDTGIIINFIDRRPGDRFTRIDGAEQSSPVGSTSKRPAVRPSVVEE